MMLAFLFSLKTIESLQIGVATHFQATQLLPPANKVCTGYVFTPVCQSFCSQGGMSASVHAGIHTPLGRHPRADTLPLGRHPPLGQTPSPVQCMLGDTGNKRAVRILLKCILVTGCNEVVAKVIFLHLSVILLTGGVLPQCMLGYHPPPGADTTTPWSRHPPRADPPGTRPPRSRHHPPPGPDSPPGSRLQYTVYERPVRILLECILVFNKNSGNGT